jgi:hypothetical protein
MSFKNKEAYNAYMNQYMLKRYYRTREKILDILGRECALCGSKESLEIDHIDYTIKKFNIAKCHSYSTERLLDEVSKCRVLCKECHKEKSIKERSRNSREDHGTMACYKHGNCRCDLCRKANSSYCKNYRLRRKFVPIG